ncbi:MAG: response regulator transcription factor [Stackebrandtia sp.]
MAAKQKSPIPQPRAAFDKAAPWQWVATAAQRVANEAARGPCSEAGLRVFQAALRVARGTAASCVPAPPAAPPSPRPQLAAAPEPAAPVVLCGKQLTERESQVLAGLAAGKRNEAIGRELHLSELTVKTHLGTLFRKIGASNRAHAVAIAFRQGVLS